MAATRHATLPHDWLDSDSTFALSKRAMFLAPHIKRLVGVVLIAGLLFAQAAFALRPCVDQNMSAASAIAASQQHDCCEQTVKEVSLCVAKCSDSSRLAGPDSFKFPPASAAAGLPLYVAAPPLVSPIAYRHAGRAADMR